MRQHYLSPVLSSWGLFLLTSGWVLPFVSVLFWHAVVFRVFTIEFYVRNGADSKLSVKF